MRVSAFRDDDALGHDDAVGLVERLRKGEVSHAELIEAAIARIEQVNPMLDAVALRDYDRARATQPRGFFAGVPSLIKDNADVAGLPTQQGTDAFVAPPAKADGDLARAFRFTGLVSLGKTKLPEYGFSASAADPDLGPVRSPWDTTRTAGASSSGAGALVAAGAVPLAHGNDGGGSIRIPASVNGLVGLKPSRGRVPTDAINLKMPIKVVADGVLTRSVRDTAAFLREVERYAPAKGLPRIGDVRAPAERRLRVAVLTQGIDRSADAATAKLTLQTGELLESLGHRVEEVERPPISAQLADDFVLYWGFLAGVIMATGRLHGPTWDARKLDNLTRGLATRTARQAWRVPVALRRLRQAIAIAEDFHRTYDVVLTPTLGHETPAFDHLDPTQPFETVIDRLRDWVVFTPWQNVTGAPAVSLPVATSEGGLPQGMMFGAAPGEEAMLLGLAYELEQAAPWPRIS